ncbi:BTB/Kelch-associated,BTB-kelch protein,BTB/POZ domain,Kelch repeat type 1,Kelch-type beta [Cinara cedri]|uniref:Kelch-like protein diablo n=1 Tax=Cinara cedri TaxID=506608 RepID=A0A5E4LZH2_9HEMI|nr:BTB/Kelch-associated,BTB-kelch protein,BTB/POZ domain,Kelch repeat type 1,Kelch-type beta [Cinara cedri]
MSGNIGDMSIEEIRKLPKNILRITSKMSNGSAGLLISSHALASIRGPTAQLVDPLNPESTISNRPIYISNEHLQTMSTEFRSMRRNHELCDVVLNINNREVFAHRIILSACSPYFRAMFQGKHGEPKKKKVVFFGLNEIGIAIQLLIEYCYSSGIRIEESNVQNLLSAACLLQMNEIKQLCCKFLKSQLNSSTCLGIKAFAEKHYCFQLSNEANKYALKNFQEVVESKEFLLLPISELIDFISSDELIVKTEEQVFSATMSWVKYKPERRQSLSKVLQHVRLPLINPKFLIRTVASDRLIRSDEECKSLIDEAKDYLLLPEERSLIQGPRTRHRIPTRKGELLFVAGGLTVFSTLDSCGLYDIVTKDWKEIAPMFKENRSLKVAVLNDSIYIIGKNDDQLNDSSIERFNPQTNRWFKDVPPLITNRVFMGVAVLDGYLYIVGGLLNKKPINNVERYDPKENKWSIVAPMTTARCSVGAVALGDYLYAIGGLENVSTLASVERYDPRMNKWTVIAPMSERRRHLGCAAYNNMIYAVGGHSENPSSIAKVLKSVERYNPLTNSWSPIAPISTRRAFLNLAVVNGKLYAVGGRNTRVSTNIIEEYDEIQNQWRLCGTLNGRFEMGIGVIRSP